jgi:hypothetical protein
MCAPSWTQPCRSDPQANVIVLGDLNDGPGLDYFEELYLSHNVNPIGGQRGTTGRDGAGDDGSRRSLDCHAGSIPAEHPVLPLASGTPKG